MSESAISELAMIKNPMPETARDEATMVEPTHGTRGEPAIDTPVLDEPTPDDQNLRGKDTTTDVTMGDIFPSSSSTKENEDDVMVTHTRHQTPPKTSSVLVKTSMDTKPVPSGEATHEAQLTIFEDMGLKILHQEYITRLARHHEEEGALVTLMKKKYEECPILYL